MNKEEALDFIKRVSNSVSDLYPVLFNFGKKYKELVRRQFESEGVFFLGTRWPPLSERYRKWKERNYGKGLKILRLTHRLFKSLTQETEDSIFLVNERRLIYGTKVFYAKFHQYGGRKIPQREFLFVNRKLPTKAIYLLKDEMIKYIKVLIKGTK